jgi:hypothetical protein
MCGLREHTILRFDLLPTAETFNWLLGNLQSANSSVRTAYGSIILQ